MRRFLIAILEKDTGRKALELNRKLGHSCRKTVGLKN